MNIGWRTRAVLLLVICATMSLAQVQNGSFELPVVPADPGWAIVNAPSNYWNVTNVGFDDTPADHKDKLEFHRNNAFDGTQYMELDVYGGTVWLGEGSAPAGKPFGTWEMVWQTLNGVTAGTTYDLSFAFKGRPGFVNAMSVYVKNDQTNIASMDVEACGGAVCGDNPWVLHTLRFTAGTGETSIWFTEGGIDDGYGDWVDGVSLAAVDSEIPEPGTIAMVLGGLALLALRRRS